MTSTLALLLALVGLGSLAAGILVGRYYVPDDRMLRRAARHARSYARAASRILEGEQREAIDELKQVVAENVDDIEPYFALGALFRAQGDWERAIRIHQSIAAREAGNKPVQVRAFHALGLDFRRAGMPRRATRALESCLALDGKHESALRVVTALYEEQGRYEDAAESLHRLQKLRNEEPSMRHHHLLVAAAQRAVYAGELDRAKRLLRHGRRIDEHSVHYLTAAAELAAARGDATGAGASLRDALRLAPELAGFLVPGLIEAERQLVMAGWDRGQEEQGERADAEAWAVDSMTGHLPGRVSDHVTGHGAEEGPGSALDRVARAQLEEAARRVVVALEEVAEARDPHLQLAMAELRSHYDPARALEDYRHIAEAFAGLLPARVAAARLALAGGEADEIRAELKALVAADGVLAWATEGSWRCSACGHRQPDYFWRCGSCRGWGTARLDVGRDALEPPLPPHWEPRPRLRGGVDAALRGAAERALPMPLGAAAALGAPAHAGEVWQPGAGARTGAAPTMLSRVGAWFSGVSRSLARRQREDTASFEPRALAPGRDASADNAVDGNEPTESNQS